MRPEFTDVLALGALPAADDLSPALAQQYQAALERLPEPLGDEATALLYLLPPDDSTSFGLAWALVHKIESSPEWPVWSELDGRTYWRAVLRDRAIKPS